MSSSRRPIKGDPSGAWPNVHPNLRRTLGALLNGRRNAATFGVYGGMEDEASPSSSRPWDTQLSEHDRLVLESVIEDCSSDDDLRRDAAIETWKNNLWAVAGGELGAGMLLAGAASLTLDFFGRLLDQPFDRSNLEDSGGISTAWCETDSAYTQVTGMNVGEPYYVYGWHSNPETAEEGDPGYTGWLIDTTLTGVVKTVGFSCGQPTNPHHTNPHHGIWYQLQWWSGTHFQPKPVNHDPHPMDGDMLSGGHPNGSTYGLASGPNDTACGHPLARQPHPLQIEMDENLIANGSWDGVLVYDGSITATHTQRHQPGDCYTIRYYCPSKPGNQFYYTAQMSVCPGTHAGADASDLQTPSWSGGTGFPEDGDDGDDGSGGEDEDDKKTLTPEQIRNLIDRLLDDDEDKNPWAPYRPDPCDDPNAGGGGDPGWGGGGGGGYEPWDPDKWNPDPWDPYNPPPYDEWEPDPWDPNPYDPWKPPPFEPWKPPGYGGDDPWGETCVTLERPPPGFFDSTQPGGISKRYHTGQDLCLELETGKKRCGTITRATINKDGDAKICIDAAIPGDPPAKEKTCFRGLVTDAISTVLGTMGVKGEIIFDSDCTSRITSPVCFPAGTKAKVMLQYLLDLCKFCVFPQFDGNVIVGHCTPLDVHWDYHEDRDLIDFQVEYDDLEVFSDVLVVRPDKYNRAGTVITERGYEIGPYPVQTPFNTPAENILIRYVPHGFPKADALELCVNLAAKQAQKAAPLVMFQVPLELASTMKPRHQVHISRPSQGFQQVYMVTRLLRLFEPSPGGWWMQGLGRYLRSE